MSHKYIIYQVGEPEYPPEAKLPRGQFWLHPFAPLHRPTRRSLRYDLQYLRHKFHEEWFRCYDTSRLTMALIPERENDAHMLRARVDWLDRWLRRFDMHLAREARAARRTRHSEAANLNRYTNYQARMVLSEEAFASPQPDIAQAVYSRIVDGIKRRMLDDEQRAADSICKRVTEPEPYRFRLANYTLTKVR